MEEKQVMEQSYTADQVPNSNRNGLATASLVLGIIAIVSLIFIPFLDILFSILALIFGIMSLKSERRGSAIAGIVLSSIVLGIYLIGLFLLITIGAAFLSLF